MQKFLLDGDNLTIQTAKDIVDKQIPVGILPKSVKDIQRSRDVIDKWIKENKVIYGVTTGFGEFKDVRIPASDLKKLQLNLIRSHAAGTGECLPKNIIRLILLLRINSLVKGYSGVRLDLVEFLVSVFNKNLVPYIPSKGSVGSSGDLAPLAHLALFLIGEGYGFNGGNIEPAAKILNENSLTPFKPEAKEGLALVNGTQMMTAYAVEIIARGMKLSKLADISGALSNEALKGSDKAYSEKLQRVRPHRGQIRTAENMRDLLSGSKIRLSHVDCDKVQDAYSLRCIPQVHGAFKDTVEYAEHVTEIEINSVTDNPLIFPSEGKNEAEHIEGGNFHGEPIALAMDYLGIAISELGNISERRIARLVDGSLSGLPRFLTSNGGLNSGLMIAQYTAAALVSENKVLSHPASVDSIPTSANQEDHNSMGSIAAQKCFDILNNVEKIIAIESLCACQGIDFLRPLKCGRGTETAYQVMRKNIQHIKEDKVVSELISSASDVIFSDGFLEAVEKKTGVLHS